MEHTEFIDFSISVMLKKLDLYGGAISTVLPEGFLDASLLREVPDTQEIFVNSRETGEKFEDGLGLNESIVVDLLERVSEINDYGALKVHLEEITDLNAGRNMSMVEHETLANGSQCCVATESIDKWGKQEKKETVVLCVGLIRLAEFSTDVVIMINVPVEPAMHAELDQLAKNRLPERATTAYELLKSMVREFKVVDGSLFV